jgi:hypothetical protein
MIEKTILGDDEEISIFITHDEIEIDYWCGNEYGSSRMNISPAVARELAAHLLRLADQIEGKE